MTDPLALGDVERIDRSPLTVTALVPATGADWTLTVPGSDPWEIVQVRATFQTGNAPGSRLVRLENLRTPETLAVIYPAAYAAANLVFEVLWQVGLGYATSLNALGAQPVIATGIAPLSVEPGTTLRTRTASMDAGDKWSAITIVYRRLRSLKPSPARADEADGLAGALLAPAALAAGAAAIRGKR